MYEAKHKQTPQAFIIDSTACLSSNPKLRNTYHDN